MDKVKVGLVGAGIWGTMHARAYTQHPLVDLAAVCDLDENRARQVAEQYGVAHVYTDVVAMIENENLQGISVATPDATHTPIVLEAVAKGLHILVEKPLATTVAECEQMISAAKAAGVLLMVDWHNRWNPPYHHAWQAIRAGELGDVRYIYYRLSDTVYVPTKMLPWAAQSTVMWFLGSHALDTTCWLMGKRPTRIYCQKRAGMLAGMGVDTPDLYVTLLDFEDGALAIIENTWILPQASPALIDHKCEILGTQGAIYIDPTHDRSFAKYTPQTIQGFPNAPFADMFITPEIHGKQMGFAVESISHFVDCIYHNRPPLATGHDGLLNTRLIQAAEKSAQIGMPVDLGLDR
ncbi:MAG: Gfo/Idh/MocA family oxidoreductase [Anaerolineae bacterium]|nr:Gfo/Idh/MocA family oxidoreductase [Anaerolineae bacterium]